MIYVSLAICFFVIAWQVDKINLLNKKVDLMLEEIEQRKNRIEWLEISLEIYKERSI